MERITRGKAEISYYHGKDLFILRIEKTLIGVKLWQQDKDCITLNQIHSNIAIRLTDLPENPLEGDAIVTNKSCLKIGVKTADCVPIVLVGKTDIAVVHAGWKGLKNGIIESTLKIMEEDTKDIFAFLGPSAKACCYQVDESFKEILKALNYRNEKFYMDTQIEALLKLKSLGVKRFFLWNTCTICHHSLPSYRRDKTQERILTFAQKV